MTLRYGFLITASLATILLFQNCSQSNFSLIDPAAKHDKLEYESVFGEGGSAQVPVYGENGNVVSATGLIPLEFMCSSNRTTVAGSNLGLASTLKVELSSIPEGGAAACSFTSGALRAAILDKHALPVTLLQSSCANIPNGKYYLIVRDPNRLSRNLLQGLPRIEKMTSGFGLEKPMTQLLIDINPDTIRSGSAEVRSLDVACDEKASPLVVHFNADFEKAEPLVLTSPAQGVLFDILGVNSFPKAHSKKQISWHRSSQYYYLTLPRADGKVTGINELFGDNSKGPDGQFAADGYAALAKYDGIPAKNAKIKTADGYITKDDEVFERLRLWSDRNFDGIATRDELIPLSAMGVEVIDLNFDASYSETDRYGNQTMYKSVVKTKDGRLHLLFDIWFRYE